MANVAMNYYHDECIHLDLTGCLVGAGVNIIRLKRAGF